MNPDATLTSRFVFGERGAGLSPDEAARRSERRFVRGSDQVSVYDPDRNPTGHVLTASEAYRAFGLDVLEEAVEYGSGVILRTVGAIESALKERREELGLSHESVARSVGLAIKEVSRAETDANAVPIQWLERIAFLLGLDERLLAFDPKAGADADLAVRLRTLQTDAEVGSRALGPGTVLLFAEAASIVRVHSQLQEALGVARRSGEFEPHSDYGGYGNPAWRIGYELAERARERLGLGERPIKSMRALVEDELRVPVIQAELPSRMAGATVAVSDEEGRELRGIVLNMAGRNENVWVRRATLAHEVGHLLYDPEDCLERVRVDTYELNDANPEFGMVDYVEQRANAFAVAFLAPNEAVRRTAPAPISGEGVSKVMRRFGLSLTSAQFHVSNSHYRQYDMPSDIPGTWPNDRWRADEDFTADYFPIHGTPIQRRGRFAGVVAEAHRRGLIGEQTAAAYLACGEDEFLSARDAILSIYPSRV